MKSNKNVFRRFVAIAGLAFAAVALPTAAHAERAPGWYGPYDWRTCSSVALQAGGPTAGAYCTLRDGRWYLVITR
ncbi:hypothetical protein [Nonomuraea sp. NPDC050783]|uniref:hypothetical protein n=1 Tax=Nonomuraea sp. NPDC050783 TaxID=3154634 RepID=UPI003464ED70